jgi:uncharacterized iron-regulated membrane protein
MLMWIEDHLIVLGLLAIVSGIGLGGLLTWTQRNAGRIVASPRRAATPPASMGGASGSGTTGAGSAKARYQARSW